MLAEKWRLSDACVSKRNIYIPSQNITFIRANDMGEQLGFTKPSVYIKTVFRSGYKIVSEDY